MRYEDQPTTTLAYLRARRFGIVPEVVYHWRIRSDGTSITQQRSSTQDLRDRWETKLTSLRSVEEYGAPKVTSVFRDRVLAGDLHRYFAEIPGCDDEWWELLRTGVLSIWGSRSLTHSGLLPADRLVGWLVEQGRREDAAAVVTYVRDLGRPLDRVETPDGRRLDVPVLDLSTVAPAGARAARHRALRDRLAISMVERSDLRAERARLVIGPGDHGDCEARERSERRHGLGAEAHEGKEPASVSKPPNVVWDATTEVASQRTFQWFRDRR